MSAPRPLDVRILLVEDSDTQALRLRALLQNHHFLVDRHSTAEGALESLNQELPDLILADYHLPGMNGHELARQVRMNVRTRSIPMVMLTQTQERDIERHGLESGADAYVAKSAGVDDLVLRIDALLRQRRLFSEVDGAAAPTSFRRTRLLVLDEGATFRTYLSSHLSAEGYAVTAAWLPEAAVEAAALGDCDCVLLNLSSTEFDGLATCHELNALRAGRPAPFQIIGLWGPSSTEGIAQGFAAGADEVIAKSAEIELVKVRIRALMRRKLLWEENRRIEEEFQHTQTVLQRARSEKQAAEAKAGFAEALEQSNTELERANRKLKETQAQLVHAAKMASLGELVAGIAHEINNPLSFILGHQRTVEKLVEDFDQGDLDPAKLAKCRERVAAMRLGLSRIEGIIINLRRFSRLDEGDFQNVNVVESIEAVLIILNHKLANRIAIERRYDGGPELFCSPALLNQVVMNIVSNAADAISGEGRIAITTTSEDSWYRIAIADSGLGVSPEIRSRIFDPFFTTKPVGVGTGLGLAIAYGIVQAHNGRIDVDNNPGGGTTFTVVIPRDLKARA